MKIRYILVLIIFTSIIANIAYSNDFKYPVTPYYYTSILSTSKK